jgi:hypothetical protein
LFQTSPPSPNRVAATQRYTYHPPSQGRGGGGREGKHTTVAQHHRRDRLLACTPAPWAAWGGTRGHQVYLGASVWENTRGSVIWSGTDPPRAPVPDVRSARVRCRFRLAPRALTVAECSQGLVYARAFRRSERPIHPFYLGTCLCPRHPIVPALPRQGCLPRPPATPACLPVGQRACLHSCGPACQRASVPAYLRVCPVPTLRNSPCKQTRPLSAGRTVGV